MNRHEGQILADVVPTQRKKRLALGIVTHQISGATAWWIGTAEVTRQQDVDLFVLNAGNVGAVGNIADNLPDAVHHLIDPERLDGLILAQWWPTREVFEAFYNRYYHPLPVVNLHRNYEGYPGVAVDNYQGMMAELRHLIEVHGYRRLAYIGGLPDNPSANARYAAYVAALTEYDIPLDENLILPGDFSPQAGTNAVHVLLDERGLRPTLDFEVIVASNDYMATTALEELHRRGIRVPLDVAVVGFDDVADSAYTIPPLTTVRMPNYEMSRVAAEVVLAAIKRQPVDQYTLVPGELVVRQSCGCLVSPLADAGEVARLPASGGPPESPSAGLSLDQRARVIAELSQSVGPAGQILDADWAKEMLAAFIVAISGPPDDQRALSNRLLGTFHAILRQLHINGYDLVGLGRMILFTLRRCVHPTVTDLQQIRRAEGVWQQAMAFVMDVAYQMKSSQQHYGASYVDQLRVIGERLITTFETTELLDLIAGELPRVDIPSVYIALYTEPTRQLVRLALAYNVQGRTPLGVEGQIFRASQLLPEGLLSQDRPSVMVVVPLYFHDTALGFALFEARSEQGEFYETLGRQISSALQGALLVQRLQERSAELARQQYVLNMFMENVPDRIYFKDLHSRFTRANQALAQHLGLSDPAQQIGKSDWDFFPPEQAKVKYEQEQQIIRTGQPILGLEEPDGTGHWALTTKMPLRDEHGTIIGTFGISRDITQLKQVQAALERACASVEQQVEERTAELQREIVERKRIEVQLERNLRETRVRLEVSQALTSAETEDQVLDVLIQHAGLYSQAFVALVTFDKTGSELVAVERRADPFESGVMSTSPVGTCFPASRFPILDLLSADRPFVSNDVASDERIDPLIREGILQMKTTSLAAFPLTVSEWMGYIAVFAKSVGYFDEEKQHLYRTLAEQGAVALQAARLQETIRESKQRFQVLVETMTDLVWEIDENDVYTYASPRVKDILGYTPEEVLGKTLFDFMPPEEARRVVEIFGPILEARRPLVALENINLHKDGHEVIFETNGAPFFDAEGRFKGYRGSDRDITERKQTRAQLERNLRETRVRLEISQALAGAETEDEVLDVLVQHVGLYPQAHVGILTFDRTGSELAIVMRRGKPFESGVPIVVPEGTHLPASHFPVLNLFSGDQPFVLDDAFMDERVDLASRGLLCQAEATSFAVFPLMAGNERIGLFFTLAKPTGFFDEEKQHLYQALAEQGAAALQAARLRAAIRESQQRLSLLVQQSPLAVIEWDIDLRVVSWNPAAERIFGYTSKEALGSHIVGFIVPEAARPLIDQFWQDLSVQQGSTHSVNENLTKDGRIITCEWFNAPLVDAGNQVIGVVSLTQDITERKQAESEREALIAELETKNAELERFTYTVSHDLKSPLITIGGFVGFLEKDALTGNQEQIKADVAHINDAVSKMQRLLNELLELSRIGRQMNPPVETSFEAIAREAVRLVHGRIAAHGVEVKIATGLPTVHGDRARLVEVVQNLVDNACKFMDDQPQPRIEIGTRESDEMMVFYVRDNGIGIEPQYHNKVFGLFEKLDPQSEGTGIGLTLVRRIIETHGGRIWVESEGTGQGSTFCFTLPAKEQ
jgi:PAS domain S-box-containing protein